MLPGAKTCLNRHSLDQKNLEAKDIDARHQHQHSKSYDIEGLELGVAVLLGGPSENAHAVYLLDY